VEAEERRAKKLHMPMAVAAKRTGKKYEFAAKTRLNEHVTPNFVSRKQTKNQIEL
jgi:hypothetical protein